MLLPLPFRTRNRREVPAHEHSPAPARDRLDGDRARRGGAARNADGSSDALRRRLATMWRAAPVVFLPGLLGGAFGFRKVTPALAAAGHPTFAIEPLGVGSSSHPGRWRLLPRRAGGSRERGARYARGVECRDRLDRTSARPSHCASPIAIPSESPRSLLIEGGPGRSLLHRRRVAGTSARAGVQVFRCARHGAPAHCRCTQKIFCRSGLGHRASDRRVRTTNRAGSRRRRRAC